MKRLARKYVETSKDFRANDCWHDHDDLRSIGKVCPADKDRLVKPSTHASGMKRLISYGSAFSILCHAGMALVALLSPTFAYEPIAELPSINVEFVAAVEPTQSALQVAKLEQVASLEQVSSFQENPVQDTVMQHRTEEAPAKELPLEVKPPDPAQELPKNVEVTPPAKPLPETAKLPEMQAVLTPKLPPKALQKPKPVENIENEPDLQDIREERQRKQQERQNQKRQNLAKTIRATQAKETQAKQTQVVTQQENRAETKATKAKTQAAKTETKTVRAETGMSQATYAALISAQINARKFYPASARSEEVTGAVGVAFTIGSSGRAKSANVIRSSGNGALDLAARQAVLSVSAPPPPQGLFNGSINVRFNLN